MSTLLPQTATCLRTLLCASLLMLASTSAARAEVVDHGPSGFSVKLTTAVSAPAPVIYQKLVGQVGSWWNSDHTWSGNAANLSIDPSPGGCFCEKLPNGGVRHLTVVYADAGKVLRLTGGLGPFQDMAVTGVLTFMFAEKDGTTAVTITYKVGGYLPGGSDALGNAADGMLGEQLARLKRYVETGRPQ